MAHQVSLLLLFLIFSRLSAASCMKKGCITITCRYDRKYTSPVKYWCKGYYWDWCSYAARTDDKKSHGRISISDNINQGVFTVIMTDLEPSDYGYYWCGVEINGGSDIKIQWFKLPVSLVGHQITVNPWVSTECTTTTTTTSKPKEPTSASLPSGPAVNPSHSTDGSSDPEENTTQGSEEIKEDDHQWLGNLKIPLIILVMLVLLIAGVLVAWKMWRKHCKGQ